MHISSGLKDSAQTATRRRKGFAGKTIVVVQVSLAMLLLVGAGLFVRTLVNLGYAHLGFKPGPSDALRYRTPSHAIRRARISRSIANSNRGWPRCPAWMQ